MSVVLAVLQQREGRLHRGSWEAIAAARRLAPAGQTHAVLLGRDLGAITADLAARAGVATLHFAAAPVLEPYTPGAYRGVLAPLIRELDPSFVVFPHTYQTVDFMARLAVDVGAAVVPEVIAIDDEGRFRRPVLGGKLHATVRVKGHGPIFVSVQSGAFVWEAAEAAAADTRSLAVPGDLVADREILGVETAGGEAVDLTKAAAIVAAGRGVGGADKMAPLHDLAAALGADVGASRPVIDNGWLPRDRQIGSSGQTVAPRLYVAAGISGAIQHLVGMKGSSVIVAINKDPGAPIFSVAHYGVVADLHEFVPAFAAAVRALKAEG